jgi:hypothetical protein
MKRTATDVLRDHARERWLRRAIRSVNLDGDLGSTPRMSESAYVDSCQLVRGVPAELLDVLGMRECVAVEATWTREAAEHLGVPFERHTEQVAKPLTLMQAAVLLGLGHLDYEVLKAMRLAAIACVSESLLARSMREKGKAA